MTKHSYYFLSNSADFNESKSNWDWKAFHVFFSPCSSLNLSLFVRLMWKVFSECFPFRHMLDVTNLWRRFASHSFSPTQMLWTLTYDRRINRLLFYANWADVFLAETLLKSAFSFDEVSQWVSLDDFDYFPSTFNYSPFKKTESLLFPLVFLDSIGRQLITATHYTGCVSIPTMHERSQQDLKPVN